jgi:two-component system sensor kinase FixL
MLDPSGNIVSWNTGAELVYGYRADEMVGRHFSSLYSIEDAASGLPDVELAIASSTGRLEESGLRTRKGRNVFWASSVITPLHHQSTLLRGFAMVTRDISERKDAEPITRLAHDPSANALIVVDTQGMIIQAGPQVENLFGYSQAALASQHIQLIVPQLSVSDHFGRYQRLAEDASSPTETIHSDLTGRHENGNEFLIKVKVRPIHTHDGLVASVWIISIFEHKQCAKSADSHLAELAHTNRLASIGEMFSKLSHEANQSLAAASNYARTCVRSAEMSPGVTQDQLLEWMRKTAALTERASEIVNRVGSFVKKQSPNRALLNINDLVAHVIAFPALLGTTPDSASRTSVTLELDQQLPLIFADRILIEQVLMNLVRNAIESMEGIDDCQRTLLVRSEQVGDMAQVSVSDTGHGLLPEQEAKLFNPFFTTKANGTGLGLSISRTIIETHQGRLFVKPKPDSGTTVLFQLPIARREDTSCIPI